MTIRLRTSLLRSLITAAAGAMAFILLGASPAAAHYVYQEGHVYRTNDLCVHERSEISHGDGGGYSRVDVSSTTILAPGGAFPCAHANHKPANNIAAKIQVLAWNGSAWYVCAETAWVYNDHTTWQLIIESRMLGLPWCGTGWYGTMGHGYVWNNAWYGGTMWSGNHWLPDYSLSATEAPTHIPEAGDTVGVLDASGNEVLDADGEPVTVVVGEAPASGPDTAIADAGTSLTAEDGSTITEIPLYQTSELVTNNT
ncbi:hypothetical protein GFD30_11270 [Glycomyces sp. NEAU-7082]|uniref:Uncharacterized protein n=2 Tax=Glycomyces albidus TaxID=2656774 RepID=A0A6L5G955_9ACTN|nr:hypothetical protein [Glycomyces albidus]